MRRLFCYSEHPNFPARYNIAPTQPIAVVMADHGARHFRLMRWGFMPDWVKDPSSFSLLINARAETVSQKPAFRGAIRHRRCLIPATGFYEWARGGESKTPYFIEREDGEALALGGIWETYMHADGSEVDTVAILTTAPNELMRHIHDRMPVVIPPQQFDLWLDPMAGPEDFAPLMRPARELRLKATPLSTRVNSVANDDAGLLAPLGEPLTAALFPSSGEKDKEDGGQLDLF